MPVASTRGLALLGLWPLSAHAFTPTTKGELQIGINFACQGVGTDPGSPMGAWNTALVTDMSYLFQASNCAGADVTAWNTANVVNFEGLAYTATTFDGDFSAWNTAKVTSFRAAFVLSDYNGDVSAWNTANGVDFRTVFQQAPNLNSDLSAWNVAKGDRFDAMFELSIFNRDIGSWNVASATDFTRMFATNQHFNQNLNAWNVAQVTSMHYMFLGSTVFNGDISAWNTNNVATFGRMFKEASAFDNDISAWDTAKANTLSEMFKDSNFNRDIGAWNVARVTNFVETFLNSPFDISYTAYWDTSKQNGIGNFGPVPQPCPVGLDGTGGVTDGGTVQARCPSCSTGFEDDGNGNCVPEGPGLCDVVDPQNHGKWSVDIETFHPVDDAIEVVVTEPLSGVPTATYLVSCSEASSPSSTTSGAPFGTISGNDGAVPSDSADCTDEGVKAQTFNVSNLAAFEDIQTFDATSSTFNATYVLSCQLTINSMVVSSKEKTFSVSMADNVPFVFAEGEAEAAGTAGDNEVADVGVDATQFVALTLTDGDSDDTTVTIKRAEVTEFTFGFDAVSANIDPTAYSVAAITNLQFVFDTTPVQSTLDLINDGVLVTGSTNLVGFTNAGGSFSFVLSEDFFEAGATQVTIQGDVQLGITSSLRRRSDDDVFAPMPFEQTFGLDSAEPEVPMLPPTVAGASTVAAGAGAIVSTAVVATLCL